MANFIRFDPVRTVAFSSITASYTALGSKFTHAMRLLHFINTTDQEVMISFNGTDDNIPVPASSFALYDITANEDTSEAIRDQSNTQIYVKYTSDAPTEGNVYLVTMYTKGE